MPRAQAHARKGCAGAVGARRERALRPMESVGFNGKGYRILVDVSSVVVTDVDDGEAEDGMPLTKKAKKGILGNLFFCF